ncbi:hypothetical protein SETIT_8G142400v2 [Setaria italica]|uniref:Uncharacterized protein n=3 Tax=Setaria italica TaxID=4555 RepID=A0A368S7M7_SETIT|nr:hypothetical protein SETIT_8G142400v2 [Setaria italica]
MFLGLWVKHILYLGVFLASSTKASVAHSLSLYSDRVCCHLRERVQLHALSRKPQYIVRRSSSMMAWNFVTGGRSGSSSWMVQMERMLMNANPETEMARWNKPSIYRVPEWLKNMTNRDAYRPQLVSLGPFHHGEPDLLPMEEHKRRAVAHVAMRSRRPLREFVAAVEEVADKLMDAYDNLDEKWRGARRGQFVEMMVVDGCFLLEMVKGVSRGEAPRDYAPNDPVFSKHGMIYLWGGIQADMLAIENQLPLLALYTIEQIWHDTTPLSEKDVNKLVLDFTWQPLNKDKREGVVQDILSLHALDIYHKNLCGLSPAPGGSGKHIYEESMRCAVELKEKGVHFKKCDSTHAIDFKNGVLSLPEVSVGDGNEKIFLNLMAFEQLHSGMRSDATAYLIFMDNIIDSERDVALLRSKGIIKHSLSSDRETANLFNILSKGGAVMSPHSRLHDVRRKVNDHCRKPWNKWMAIFRHTYASNPWVLISLVAAIILLVSTILQTIYSVVQFYTKS